MTATHPTVTVEIDFTTDLAGGVGYHEQVLPSAPYAYYRLKETSGTFADASGNARTGTGAGTITYNQTPSPLSGDSTARYVVFTTDVTRIDLTGAVPSTGQLTVEAFVYVTSLAVNRFIFENDGTTALSSLLEFWITTTGALSARGGNSSTTVSSAAGDVVINTWYHLAAVFDAPAQKIRLYKNGVLLTEANWQTVRLQAPSLSKLNTSWHWGTDSSTSKGSVQRLAEPAVYLRAVATAEFVDHYAARLVTPFAGYTWTNVTSYVMFGAGLRRSFGRASELDDVVTHQTEFTLKNDDRRFEVEYTGSPYSPKVVPGRPVRVRMTQDGVTYDWAFGFVEDLPQQWDRAGKHCRVPIRATCYLDRLNEEDIGARDFPEQAAGARLTTLLNAAGHPTSMRDIETGSTTLMALVADTNTVGTHARAIARTDRGLFYFAPNGFATFDDGAHRTTATRSTVSQGTIGGSGIPYYSPAFHAPKDRIRNIITMRRPGGVDQTVTDSQSSNSYGKKSFSDEIMLTTDALVLARAQTLLAAYKDPKRRIQAVTFNPASSTGYWSHALGVLPADRYVWQFTPEQGSIVTTNVFVEGVVDSYQNLVYESKWFLSVVP